MVKVLVCYFSASGNTRQVAEKIADELNSDIFEIEPVEKYTRDDLNWMNKQSRSSIEMQDKESRPEILYKITNLVEYDAIVLGFPVWWYTAPTIINTFFEENDLKGKRVYIFVTSGSASYEESFNDLKTAYPEINFVSGKRFKGNETGEELISWIR